MTFMLDLCLRMGEWLPSALRLGLRSDNPAPGRPRPPGMLDGCRDGSKPGLRGGNGGFVDFWRIPGGLGNGGGERNSPNLQGWCMMGLSIDGILMYDRGQM